jgi:hypothetical protein
MVLPEQGLGEQWRIDRNLALAMEWSHQDCRVVSLASSFCDVTDLISKAFCRREGDGAAYCAVCVGVDCIAQTTHFWFNCDS